MSRALFLIAASAIALAAAPATAQRSAPPAGRVLTFNERERGLTPFAFAGD